MAGWRRSQDSRRPDVAEGWIKRIWAFVRPHRATLSGAIVASVIGGLASSAGPYVQKVIVDDVIVEQDRPLIVWLAALLLVGLTVFFATMLRRYLGNRFSLKVQHELRTQVYSHLQTLDARVRQDLRPGDLFSRATADVTLLNGTLGRIHTTVGNIVQLITALAAMVLLSLPLAIVVAAFVPAFAITSKRLRERVFPATWYDQQSLGTITSIVAEATAGVRVIKAFGQADPESDRYQEASRDLFRSRLRTTRLNAFYGATLEALPGLAQVAVLVAGGLLALNGRITLGTFVAFASYVGQMLSPVRALAGFFSNSQQARAGAGRVLEFLETRATVADSPGAVDLSSDSSDRPTGRIDFEQVSFGYEPGSPVLRNLTLRIAAGERVAIVGLSGSGKSTAARLLLRQYDVDGGAIRVDGTDVRQVSLHSLRSQIGGVVDEPFVFSTTIRDNIAFGKEDASDAEIAAAADAAAIDGFISGLPDGYDTVVGERGMTLSGGQRQRLALARAVLSNPRVLVLDDATSAIDARTESVVFERLGNILRGRTTLVIAHRRSTLRMVDRIVVLEDGGIIADGTYAELLDTSETFRSIWGEDQDGHESVSTPAGQEASRLGRRTPGRIGASSKDPSGRFVNMVARANSEHAAKGRDRRLRGAIATPGLLEAVARLPELIGEPDLGLAGERYAGRFGLRSLAIPFRGPLISGLILVALSGILALISPMAVRAGIDSGVTGGSERALLASGGVLLVTVVVGWAVSWSTTAFTARTAERMLFVLRVRTFRHLLRLPMNFFDREMTGRIIARMTADIDSLATLFQQGLIGTAVSSVTAVGVVVVLFVLNWRLALAVAAVFIPLTVMTLIFRRRSQRAHSEARETLSAMYAELSEGIEAVGTTQMFVATDRMEARFAHRSSRYAQARLASVRVASTYFPAVQFLATVATAIVLGAGAFLIRDGSMTAGLLLAFLLYVDHLFRPMQDLSEQIDQWVAARVSLRKIGDLLMEKPEPEIESAGSAPSPNEVRMEQVTFFYQGSSTAALKDLNLTIHRGETLAVVGATGAGKSTLAKMLLGFYQPNAGTVIVNGLPLSDLDPVRHRLQVGYVQQEPILFGVSMRDNIAYGRPEASDSEVIAAARLVGVHETILALPEGYSTVVSQQGRTLSAGERQLICLARALLISPALLILDEATANLDLTAETRVQEAMRLASADRTTVIIAHRLQTVGIADRIVVMEGGRVVEDGSHQQLLALNGTYAGLWSAFSDHADVSST